MISYVSFSVLLTTLCRFRSSPFFSCDTLSRLYPTLTPLQTPGFLCIHIHDVIIKHHTKYFLFLIASFTSIYPSPHLFYRPPPYHLFTRLPATHQNLYTSLRFLLPPSPVHHIHL
ncbi:hypothetical protein FPV67DRAFT_567761 [Lyophyllum atratum]|nr:hypothetical protein FPV67DRAFT_567761 [Lyophyllum atratum]